MALLWLCVTLLTFCTAIVSSLERCSDGQMMCPEGNTCCAGGCIASDLGRFNGTCCSDGQTGCGVGYVCSGQGACVATDQVTDPLLQILPRYHLCRPRQINLETVHGFPVDDSVHKLVYYSSHGNVATTDISEVDFIFMVIHGANRNADDYFCAASAAVELQHNYRNVLVVVPRFATVSDGPILLREGGTALRWGDSGNGPWRYGARSVHPIPISSFATIDLLVDTLLRRTSPETQLAIAGHSSGGQFVQRWSLLTTMWSHRMRSIVANPSSYAYLTPLRKINGDWQIPDNIDDAASSKCSRYNHWEWGLEDHNGAGEIDDEYMRHAMNRIGNNVTELIRRFGARDVVYMIGSLDRCNISTADGWCHSHGIETSCMDELQGQTRFERHLNYFESLKNIGIHKHRRLAVQGVGHDHSLVFTRPEGLAAIFGEMRSTTNNQQAEI